MKVDVMTESETQFIEYLRSRGLAEPHRHPALNGNKKGKRPDFGLTLNGTPLFFEVKEFADRNIPESGSFSPYAPVYNKIEEALDQFDEYADHPCCLVLYSRDASFVHLDPMVVFGSALGPLSWSTPIVSANNNQSGHSFWDASKGWYWFDYQEMQPRNTHLVAIVILERFPIGYYKFSAESDRIATETGKRMSRNEIYELAHSRDEQGSLGERIPRIIVCQHPFAKFELSPEIYGGEFDECFGWVPHTARLFAGGEIQSLEALGVYPEKSPLFR
ncbi:MAG TPA: hypothetical protein DC054_24800 [Blastocatellia bacterium]|nr:hypothetical protein [Blastocatellia bacterium]